MKASKYNIVIPHKGNYIIYNTLWNKSIAVHHDDLATWGFEQNGVLKLSCVRKELLAVLKKHDIVLDDSVDELEYMKSVWNKTIQDDGVFDIVIVPTLACNFSCWYCYEGHGNKKMTDDDLHNIILMLKQVVSTNSSIHTLQVDFFGGEPLLCFDSVVMPFIELINADDFLKTFKLSVGFTTNGYYLTSDVVTYLKRYNISALQITLDGNENRHNKVRFSKTCHATYHVIVNNILNCIAQNINVVLRLNISDDTQLDVESLLADFDSMDNNSKQYLHVAIHKVWQASESVNDTIDAYVAQVRSLGVECSSYFSYPSSLWSCCYSDKKNNIIVTPQGLLYKCTARDFDETRVLGYIHDGGKVEFNSLYNRVDNLSPFDVKECIECPIFPICIGGCCQKRLENRVGRNCPMYMDYNKMATYAKRVLIEKLK